MSKRSLSPRPSSLPPSKRLHTLSGATSPLGLTFDSALYEELILLIFTNLSWIDLCAAQAVNKNWARVSLDSGLWKDQYLNVFGRTRLRGAKGFIGRTDGREIKRLPERVKAQTSDDIKDWRWMFRISWNWKKGRCATEHIEGILEAPNSVSVPTAIPTHVLLAGSMTIIASSEASLCPEVHCLPSTSAPKQTLLCGSPRHRQPFHITALALDQSPPLSGILQLAVFLSTGEFLIFSVQQPNPTTSSRKFTYVPLRASSRTAPIIQAVYHHPLLISLSEAFTLSLYDLSSDTITHTQTLTAYTTFPPSSLVLSVQAPGNRYKLVLTYAVPIFPVHFSIGVTELIISGPRESSPLQALDSAPAGPMSVVSTRTARALDVPTGWIDQEKLRSMKEQWGRKLLRIQNVASDGKWVVLAPGEAPLPGVPATSGATSAGSPYHLSGDSPASLQLYRLFLPPATSVASPPPKLTFVRHLHHTAGAVSSMALADGRCVTLGKNGGIWAWDLESGTGAEVAPPSDSVEKGTVVFDDRQIITARGGTLLVHRFDV
ncbi:hypothetical protein DFH07DRAFT_949774 [Mycena maculata]|uniref:F-box domain-containing protein n=1 Tax=Mycena maculata TaxID=230809 RepID=A0AAD7K8B7_9AGAR|nr:hypothetical protein DFH07DRAFT_949774 [Mycena maculata]